VKSHKLVFYSHLHRSSRFSAGQVVRPFDISYPGRPKKLGTRNRKLDGATRSKTAFFCDLVDPELSSKISRALVRARGVSKVAPMNSTVFI
jgi:hypothetical protein